MKIKKIISIFIIIISVAIGFYSFFVEPNKLDVTEYSIKDKELQGIKIVFVGDFHIKPHQTKRLKEIVKKINAQNPDIVLMAGDFTSGHISFLTMPTEKIAQELSKINTKYGIYTCLGNHDQWLGVDNVKRMLENNKIKVLYNSSIKITIDKKQVYIAGIQYKPEGIVPFIKALENTKSPRIILTHSPDEIKKIPPDVNLILAGHTHGGQIRLPIIGPLFTASKYHDKYAKGLIIENGKKLITTRGIGVSIIPFRLNCPPEIVVLTFTK